MFLALKQIIQINQSFHCFIFSLLKINFYHICLGVYFGNIFGIIEYFTIVLLFAWCFLNFHLMFVQWKLDYNLTHSVPTNKCRITNCQIIESNHIAKYLSSPINDLLKPVRLWNAGLYFVGLSSIHCIFFVYLS